MKSQVSKSVDFTKTQESRYLENKTFFFSNKKNHWLNIKTCFMPKNSFVAKVTFKARYFKNSFTKTSKRYVHFPISDVAYQEKLINFGCSFNWTLSIQRHRNWLKRFPEALLFQYNLHIDLIKFFVKWENYKIIYIAEYELN